MMEDEVDVQDDVQVDDYQASSHVQDLLNAALDGDFVSAEDAFTAALGSKMQDALDQYKVNLAQSIYNQETDEDETDPDDDVDVEDWESDEQ
jgi:hypothetical protein